MNCNGGMDGLINLYMYGFSSIQERDKRGEEESGEQRDNENLHVSPANSDLNKRS